MSSQAPTASSSPEMSEVSRISGVFFEPSRSFHDIAERPRWIVPLALIILAGLIYVYVFSQRVGWEHFMRQTMENSSRAAQMSPEQREQAINMQMKFAPVMGYVGVLVAIPLYSAIAAGVLLLVFNAIYSAQVRFKQVFAIMCYAGLPGLLFTALAIAVMFLKNPEDFNLQNPLMFNPGAFMDPYGKAKFLYSLASSLDLFTIWTIVLVAIGLSAAGRRLSFSKALIGVLVPWAAWVLVKASFAGLFS